LGALKVSFTNPRYEFLMREYASYDEKDHYARYGPDHDELEKAGWLIQWQSVAMEGTCAIYRRERKGYRK